MVAAAQAAVNNRVQWTRSAKAEHRGFGRGFYPHRSRNRNIHLKKWESWNWSKWN